MSITKEQIEFLKMLDCFMHGNHYQLPEQPIDLKVLYRMGAVHHLTAVVYEQLQMVCSDLKEQDQSCLVAMKRETFLQVVRQVQCADAFLKTYTKLEEAGIQALVVKGMICRNLYVKPEYRISGDEDVLIQPEQFERCDALLLQEGYQREEVDRNVLPYEIAYTHPVSGVRVELHLALFPEESGAYGHLNREFDTVFQTCVTENCQGVSVWTLHPTDHLLYLICHSLKHFLHSGFGIRQVCDMVMMAEQYGDEIDWEYIVERLQALHMMDFWNALVDIGRLHLGFSLQKAQYPERFLHDTIDSSDLLLDLLDSGVYGNSSMQRKHSANVTLAAAESGKKDTIASLKASLFPDMSYMKKEYPWLNENAWLLPAAYATRIAKYMRTLGEQMGNGEQETSIEIGINRVELLKKYHIIK